MVLVDRMDQFGMPPQFYTTLTSVNAVLVNLGFPKWTLVKWPVPPLLSFWLLLVLLMSGLRWFAMFEILFVLYKFFEEYGITELIIGVPSRSRPRTRSYSRRAASISMQRTVTKRPPSPVYDEEDEMDD